MQPVSHSQLLDEFNDYFQVEQQVSVNLVPFSQQLPDAETFYQQIPDAFKMTTELSGLNGSANRALVAMKELPQELISYLQLQTRKIDALMHYVLQSQDQPDQRHQSFSFGGAGVRVWFAQEVLPGQLFELKLFLHHNEGAIYALAQVLDCEASEQQFLSRLLFRRIREEDRDLVVRASLHEQSRQLKRKAEARQAQQQQQ